LLLSTQSLQVFNHFGGYLQVTGQILHKKFDAAIPKKSPISALKNAKSALLRIKADSVQLIDTSPVQIN
jgi:hypothetical protein